MLGSVLEIIFLYKFRALFLGAICTIVSGFALFSQDETYQAQATLLVKLGREYLYVPELADAGAKAPNPGDLEDLVNAEMQILNSRVLREKVVTEIGMERLFPDLVGADNALGIAQYELNDALSINTVPGANVVQVRTRHEDPELAAEITNQMVEEYLKERVSIFGGLRSEFAREQVANARRSMQQAADRLNTFRKQQNLYSYEDQFSMLLAEQQSFLDQLQAIETQTAGLERRRESIADEMTALAPTVTDYQEVRRNPTVEAAEDRILTLRLELEQKLQTYDRQHPAVRSTVAELAAVEDFAASQPDQITVGSRLVSNPLYRDAETDLMSIASELRELEGRKATLEQQLETNKVRLADLTNSSEELRALEAEFEFHETNFEAYNERVREAEFADAPGRQTNISIIEPAIAPLGPVGLPNKLRLIMALICGVVVGVGSAFLSFLIRPTFLSTEMVERRLGLPVLASTRFIPSRQGVRPLRLQWSTGS
ncbi:MAG: GumC family protein [Geminicoccaceae bacterium]